MDERNGRVSEMERNERLIRDIREAQDYLRDNPLPRMTEISRRVQRDAVRIRSAQDAYAYLKDNPPFRSIKDILMAADKQKRPEKALKKHIVDSLCANHPDQKRDSIERKVRNWFSGKTENLGRDIVFELCRIQDLSLQEADQMLMRICDEGIHWRNPEEIAWGYAIENELDYAQTMALAADAKRVMTAGVEDLSARTNRIRAEVMEVLHGSREELLDYLAGNQNKWGVFHNEAHELFLQFMRVLQTGMPGDGVADDDLPARMSVDAILKTYFFSSKISGIAREGIQKSIRASWPDPTVLSRMKNRARGVDVNRKVLIMLFLATNGMESAYMNLDDAMGLDTELCSRDRVRDLYKRLNLMLSRCGFRTLDPRSPFDWIILYSIAADDMWQTEEMLGGVFERMLEQNGNETQKG